MSYDRTVLLAFCAVVAQVEVSYAQLLHQEKTQPLSQAAIEDGIGKPIQRELKAGDCLMVTLDGQAATDYAAQLGIANPDNALVIPISCRILSVGSDGKAVVKGERLDINHTGTKLTERDTSRLMTIEGTIDLALVKHPIRWHATQKTNEFQTLEEMNESGSFANTLSTIRLNSAADLTIQMWTLVGALNKK